MKLGLLVLITACASHPPPAPIAHAHALGPALPARLARADLDRRIAAGELAAIALRRVSIDEVSVTDPLHQRPGELAVTSAMPGGWSSTVYADRDHRLWVGVEQNEAHFPEGTHIPATRVFEIHYAIPDGYLVGGEFRVN